MTVDALKDNRIIFLAAFLFLCISVPYVGCAETILGSEATITSDTIWTETESPYVIQSKLTIPKDVTLHIDPGVMVGIASDGNLEVDGTLDAEGTNDEPITFESISRLSINYPDLAAGGLRGDTWMLSVRGGLAQLKHTDIYDAPRSVGFKNDATGIFDFDRLIDSSLEIAFGSSVFATSTSISGNAITAAAINLYSSSTLSFVNSSIVSLGDDDCAISIDDASAVVSSSTISDIEGDAVEIFADHQPTSLIFASSTMRNIQRFGIFSGNADLTIASSTMDGVAYGIYAAGGDTILIASSTIERASDAAINLLQDAINSERSKTVIINSKIFDAPYGVKDESLGPLNISNSTFSSTSDYAVFNDGTIPVSAENNFWGDASGPYEETQNPDGLGEEIGGLVVGNVIFSPWLTFDPTVGPTPVIIVPGILGSAEKHGVWLIDPIFHVYDNLIATLEANGYTASTTLFTFSYDWRNSNTDTAVLLKAKIDEVKQICGCDKVDIVAHSMGGLVARAYVESPEYDDDIDQLIFLGTPQHGAPEDYPMWEAGESVVNDPESLFIATYLQYLALKAGHINPFNYVHDFPITSIQELLPDYDYLTIASTSEMIHYPDGYPQNQFLENLDAGLNSLLSSNIHITNIIGNTGTSTITNINVANDPEKLPEWADGYPEGPNNGYINDIGDGTVPLSSSSLGAPFDLELDAEHVWLPSEAEEDIYEKIHGGSLTKEIKESIPTRFLTAWMHSPADMVVIGPDGAKVGKDFSTGEEINQIPGAFYSGFDTDNEFVVIPDPLNGQYEVQTQGTGSGAYEVSLNDVSDSGAPESAFTGSTSVGDRSELSFSVSSTSISKITQAQNEEPLPQKIILNMGSSGGMHSVPPVSAVAASSTAAFNPDTFMVKMNGSMEAFANAYKLALASEANPEIKKSIAKTNKTDNQSSTQTASVDQAVDNLGGSGIMNWMEHAIISTVRETTSLFSNLFKK